MFRDKYGARRTVSAVKEFRINGRAVPLFGSIKFVLEHNLQFSEALNAENCFLLLITKILLPTAKLEFQDHRLS